MSRSTALFIGIFGSFAASCIGLVLVPQMQLGPLQPQFAEDEGKISDIYPDRNASLERGRAIYASEGCVYCHSQQIRNTEDGSDIERGWGVRRTVSRDYIWDDPPFLGTQRFGPDLANAGSADWRDEDKDDIDGRPKVRDAAWEYLHLYAPRTLVTSSNQPPYHYLFKKQKITGLGSGDALPLTGNDAPEAGYEIVPTPEAKALALYLLSLDRSHPLKEAAAPEAAKTGSAPAAK